MAASLRNQQAVIAPADPGGLPPAARLFLASRIARLNGDADLAAQYAGGAAPPEDARWTAILRHVDLVTTHPKDATRADIAALCDAGLTAAGPRSWALVRSTSPAPPCSVKLATIRCCGRCPAGAPLVATGAVQSEFRPSLAKSCVRALDGADCAVPRWTAGM